MTKRILGAIIGLCMTVLVQQAAAEVAALWSTGVAVPGEKVLLYLVDTEVGEDHFALQSEISVRTATVQQLPPRAGANPLDPNRAVVEILPILVRPDKPGNLELGELTVRYRSGRTATVRIPVLPVRSTAEIKWYTSPVAYGALWYIDNREGYVHQPIRAAIKLFLPQDCVQASLPQMHAVGVKVSTMQPSVQGIIATVQSQLLSDSLAFARGQEWRTADFAGELTPFREGKSDITGKILIGRQRGIFSLGTEDLLLPTLTLSALPLPPGAPPQFADTVGNYTISSTSSASSLAMNEAVEVEITVRGSGNLQQLSCPPPDDASNWKLVPATRRPIVNAAGQTVGMVFTQLMRPTAEVGGIPSFVLNYFDPQSMAYKRAATAPIALPWKETDATGGLVVAGSPSPPPAGTVPVADMVDIYGFIPPDDEARHAVVLPRWVWLLLYLPALAVFGYVGVCFIRRRLALRAADRTRERELADIAREQDPVLFLKRIGTFIESHIAPQDMDDELSGILRMRDEEVFRPEAHPTVLPEQRSGMLRCVRRALGKMVLLVIGLMSLTSGAETMEQLYNGGQYSKVEDMLKARLTQDGAAQDLLYYNIGNCEYRLGKPGYAALFYARALQLNPSLSEARANLDFIQRKEGAILPVSSSVDQVFTLLTCSQLWIATVISTSLLLLCLALHLLLSGRQRSSPWLTYGTAALAVACVLCLIDWVYYSTRETPDFSSLPPSDIAYVVQPSALQLAATDESKSLLDLPASTPVHLLARRGSWSYIRTATGTPGWVKTDAVQPLQPDASAPRVPLILLFP